MTTWKEHVANYRKTHKVSYKDALKSASATWTKRNNEAKGSAKGSASKTHKGDKNFTTKKGDKDFHREGKDVKEKKKPFATSMKKKASPCGCGGHV